MQRTRKTFWGVAFDADADDYVIKPFSSSELVDRVRAIMRRIMRCERRPNTVMAGNAVVLTESGIVHSPPTIHMIKSLTESSLCRRNS